MRRVRQTIALLTTTLASLAIGLNAGNTRAADELVVWVGAASRSVSVSDLATYAATGETSRQLNVYFSDFMTEEQVVGVRRALNMEVQLDFVPFTQYLRSPGGTCFLNVIASVLRPPARNVDGAQALRAALINAAAPDGKLGLLEFLQKYPNSQVWIDQEQLSGNGADAAEFRDSFRQLLEDAGVPLSAPETVEGDAASEELTDLPPIPLLAIDWDLLASGSVQLCQQ